MAQLRTVAFLNDVNFKLGFHSTSVYSCTHILVTVLATSSRSSGAVVIAGQASACHGSCHILFFHRYFCQQRSSSLYRHSWPVVMLVLLNTITNSITTFYASSCGPVMASAFTSSLPLSVKHPNIPPSIVVLVLAPSL